MTKLLKLLNESAKRKEPPTVIAYNRIDGPGSSLDLRLFQQSLWSLPKLPSDLFADPTMQWSSSLPRTVGITIDTGTKIQAFPLDDELIGVQSIAYGTEIITKPGEVLPIKKNWLLKILDLFGLRGVKFVLHNLRPGIQSSGLGGSASATTGVCILANELTGRKFSPIQLISMASQIEHDFGVSITGTQEQSNVLFGGVCDYVWFPWGIPENNDTGYGSSIRTKLLNHTEFVELEKRIAIFHSGITRTSSDVNTVWMNALYQLKGYIIHKAKLDIAYHFREGLRLQNWSSVFESIKEYQELRTSLCSAYMDGAKEIQGFAYEKGGVAFPLGAGGGGSILVFSPDPQSLIDLKQELSEVYREIPIKLKEKGHEIINIPSQEEIL